MSRVRMNCSGKHSAMLATCVRNGWDTAGYLAPDHPLQQALRRTVEDLAGEPVTATGVDGCGAPLFALTLGGLARAFRELVLAAPGSPERRVADAMRAYPEWTSGTSRDERLLMDAVPGLLIKGGAEGVDAFALADGRAGAVKIDDGAHRGRTPVTVATLRLLGAAVPDRTRHRPGHRRGSRGRRHPRGGLLPGGVSTLVGRGHGGTVPGGTTTIEHGRGSCGVRLPRRPPPPHGHLPPSAAASPSGPGGWSIHPAHAGPVEHRPGPGHWCRGAPGARETCGTCGTWDTAPPRHSRDKSRTHGALPWLHNHDDDGVLPWLHNHGDGALPWFTGPGVS